MNQSEVYLYIDICGFSDWCMIPFLISIYVILSRISHRPHRTSYLISSNFQNTSRYWLWILEAAVDGIGGTVSLYICKYTFFPLFISYIWYKYTLMGFRKYRSYRPSSTAFISCLQNFSTDEKGLATPRYRTWYGCEWLVLKSRGKAQIPTLKELDGLISETHTAQFGPLRHPSSDLLRFSWPRIKY